jgi:hypothetical protein
VLGRHVLDELEAAVEARLGPQQHLGAHDQVAVGQAAQAHQHDGRVRGEVAELVGAPSRAATIVPSSRTWARAFQPRWPAPPPPALTPPRTDGDARPCGGRPPRLLAHVLLEAAQVGHDLRRVARDAQAGRDDEKAQDREEPGRRVDVEELEARLNTSAQNRPNLLIDQLLNGSFCWTTVPITEAMQITASRVIAKRIDEQLEGLARAGWGRGRGGGVSAARVVPVSSVMGGLSEGRGPALAKMKGRSSDRPNQGRARIRLAGPAARAPRGQRPEGVGPTSILRRSRTPLRSRRCSLRAAMPCIGTLFVRLWSRKACICALM